METEQLQTKSNSTRSDPILTLSSLFILVGGFLGIVYWFNAVDFYHHHFFDHGLIVVTYNLLRMAFVFYMIWIVYAVGYGTLALFVPRTTRQDFSLSERIIWGFGTGVGVWHIFLLMLGFYNLYYRSIAIGICTTVLLASIPLFNQIRREISQSGRHLLATRENRTLYLTMGALIIFSLVLLLLVRGIYPGGGGDYFTHYFYYYQAVIRNHGLAPNDVWYHYYYSKGAGLYFLGMLLTDSEAPQVVTFSCVAIATLALVSLCKRVAPRSLWPAFCAILYLLYNLISISQNGGEFQKIHEETAALIVIGTWAICMYELQLAKWEKPAFVMLASIVVATAILTQAVAVYFAMFFAVKVVYDILFDKNWRRMWFYFLLGAIATVAVIGTLLMNYLVTGLATDQAFNLTWKFAHVEKLFQWGVLPNILMVAWIRDNYDKVAPSWGFDSFPQLANFMRADIFFLILFSTLIGFACYYQSTRSWPWQRKTTAQLNPSLPETVHTGRRLFRIVGALIVTFAILSMFVGHSQAASYYRFSSFFVPLLTLFCAICWGLLINTRALSSFQSTMQRITIPLILIIVTLFSWPHWGKRAKKATYNAMRFTTGQYSLFDAYARQPIGLSFGGINPGAYAAVQHIPTGARIWSTNVDSYCTAPNCQIESVISFKMSARMNEILSGTPEQAKQILQSEGLNYFIFSKNSILLDLLPYSQLFNPANISQYLDIKWTDGETYLLTWRGSDTTPIDAKFLQTYIKVMKNSEHPWFRFNKAVPAMNEAMQKIVQQPHPWKAISFPWRNRPILGLDIIQATYGENCSHKKKILFNYRIRRVTLGNATINVQNLCNEKTNCNFTVSVNPFGDPANNCEKDFHIFYKCAPKQDIRDTLIHAEALGKQVSLHC